MQRRTFLASIIGLCLAPLAKAKAFTFPQAMKTAGNPAAFTRVFMADQNARLSLSFQGKVIWQGPIRSDQKVSVRKGADGSETVLLDGRPLIAVSHLNWFGEPPIRYEPLHIDLAWTEA